MCHGRFARVRPLAHSAFCARVCMAAALTRPAVVHAHDIFAALPGWLAARIARARLVYDAHEFIIPQPDLRLSMRSRLFYRLERWTVLRADLVIAANDERAELMREHYSLPRTPLVVRNIPPLPPAPRAEDEVLRDYPQLSRKRDGVVRLVYQGDVSLGRGIGSFAAAMDLLGDGFELIVVGDGPDLDRLRETAGTNVLLLGQVPRADLNDILSLCDIGIVAYSFESLNNVYCAPNKLYEYAQAGLPVIATAQPTLRAVVEQFGIGMVVERDSAPEQIAASLRELAGAIDGCRSNLPKLLSAHRWEDERERLLGVYRELLGGSRCR